MENTDPIPILQVDEALKDRIVQLSDYFLSRFQYKAEFFARVPGRVNLIGDHIDYSGYSVCPMAIEQDVIVAVGQSNHIGLCLTNINDIYPDYQCERLIDCRNNLMQNNELHWYKYFLCGIVGALEIIPRNKIESKGLDIAVWGTIPPASGLSSSSALVSSAVLTLVHISQHAISRKEIALVSAKAERHIGTQGGAMDQAIAFLGTAGAAKLIEFNPLQTTDVILPSDAVFVIANSMVKCNKAATLEYNTRVRECKMAMQIIAKKHFDNWEEIQTLSDLQDKLGTNLSETLHIAESILKNENPTLIKRCKHVFQEAARVLEFQNICQSNKSDRIKRLGELMNQSHESLRDLYECSHDMVDKLINITINCGALGARLTGAGWGGCVVALTTRDNVEKFVNDLREELREISYYDSIKNCDYKAVVFPTEPRQGASIYYMHYP